MDTPKLKFLKTATSDGTGDYFSCSLGMGCAQVEPAQHSFKDCNNTPYVTQFALTTPMKGDFLCTYAALIAMLITSLLVASGGAALAVVIGWTAFAGGAGLTIGLFCGSLGAMFRVWVLPKTNVFIGKTIPQNPMLANSYMQCAPFGGIVTYNPKVTNWWQALLVLVSNTVLEVFNCIMIGAAAYTFATIAILASAGYGLRFLLTFIFNNAINNLFISLTKTGLVVRAGVTVNQIIQDKYVTPGDVPLKESVAKGALSYEYGIMSSIDDLLRGQIKMEQALGLIGAATPIEYAKNSPFKNTGTEPIQQNQQQEIPNQAIRLNPEQLEKLHDQANKLQKIKIKTHEEMVEEQRADSDRLGINTLEDSGKRIVELQSQIEALEKQLYDPNLSPKEIKALKDESIKAQEKLRGLEQEAKKAMYTDKEWEKLQDHKKQAKDIEAVLEYDNKNPPPQLTPLRRQMMGDSLKEHKQKIQEIEKKAKNKIEPRPEVLPIIDKMNNVKQQIEAIKNKLANPKLSESQKRQLATDLNNLKAKQMGDASRIEENLANIEIEKTFKQISQGGVGELYSTSSSEKPPSKTIPEQQQIAEAQKYFDISGNPYRNIKSIGTYKRMAETVSNNIEKLRSNLADIQMEALDPLFASNAETRETLQIRMNELRMQIADQITQLKLLSDALGDKINQSTQIPNPMADLLKDVKEKIEQYTPKD